MSFQAYIENIEAKTGKTRDQIELLPTFNFNAASYLDKFFPLLEELGFNTVIVELPAMTELERAINQIMLEAYHSADFLYASDGTFTASGRVYSLMVEKAYALAYMYNAGLELPNWLIEPHYETIGEVYISQKPDGYYAWTVIDYLDQQGRLKRIPTFITNNVERAQGFAIKLDSLINQFKDFPLGEEINADFISQLDHIFETEGPISS